MKKAAVAIALLLASLALVACGGSDDGDSTDTGAETGTTQESGQEAGGEKEGASGGGGGETLSFEADPSGALAYTTDEVTAKPGEVTVSFTNPAAVPHNVDIEDEGGKEVATTEVITESSETTTADLKPGTYTYYCAVDGHQAAGMEGTLTVK
jgi:plastocyanin